jgi:dUTPase
MTNSVDKNQAIDTRRSAQELPNGNPGPFLAKVVGVVDPEYMGKVRVQILRRGANGSTTEGELAWASFSSPFFGTTSSAYLGKNNTYDDTQKSYGMWNPTPDIGSHVLVAFVEGMANQGYCIGCVPHQYKNFSVPGFAATSLNYKDKTNRLPVGEFNAKTNDQAGDAATNAIKPVHSYMFDTLKTQGLTNDDIRGITSSSARRETPSRVFGISTPGPVDRKGPTGQIGQHDNAKTAAVSKLGGHSFVMDDGDEKFVRKGKPGEAPAEYVTGFKNGQANIPHNELIRLRSRTGHQILLHDSEGIVYIGNASGNTWIELTANGKIDIYAGDSVSIHTGTDINITADRDINLHAKNNVNIKADNKVQVESGANLSLKVGADGFITTKGIMNLKSNENRFEAAGKTSIKSATHAETAGKIYMNSATAADGATEAETLGDTIAGRIPMHEPWSGHENLDPSRHTPDKTNRESKNKDTSVPKFYDTYTAPHDTFKQGKK